MAASESAIAGVAVAISKRRSESAGRRALRRFIHHRGALIGLGILAVFSIMAVFAPAFSWKDPNLTNTGIQYTPPNSEFLLGADRLGRDLWARLLYAGRVSLSVGIAAAFVATGIGLLLGLIAGMFGGVIDTVIMRTTDAVLAIPTLIAIAIVVGIVGTGLEIVVLVIGLFYWTEAARVVRAVVLSLREQEFVTAARALGARNMWIIRRHLLFHALAPLTVTGTFMVAIALLTEATLSFLGIGVKPPTSSWGNMLYDAQQLFILRDHPWYWIPPGVAIFVAVLAVNLVGDGLRDALDPHG